MRTNLPLISTTQDIGSPSIVEPLTLYRHKRDGLLCSTTRPYFRQCLMSRRLSFRCAIRCLAWRVNTIPMSRSSSRIRSIARRGDKGRSEGPPSLFMSVFLPFLHIATCHHSPPPVYSSLSQSLRNVIDYLSSLWKAVKQLQSSLLITAQIAAHLTPAFYSPLLVLYVAPQHKEDAYDRTV